MSGGEKLGAKAAIAAITPDPLLVQALEALRDLSRYEGHMAWCGHGNDMGKPCVCGLNDKHEAASAIIAQAKERGL